MANEYPLHLRRQARRLWLSGQYTDQQIAAKLGIPRADTIRDWRNEEDWRPLADDLETVLKEEVDSALRAKTKSSRGIYEQLAQILESAAVRHLKNASLPPRELKAISGTLLNAQRIRERAVGANGRDPADRPMTVAEQFAEDRRKRDRMLGRCRQQEPRTNVEDDSGSDVSARGA